MSRGTSRDLVLWKGKPWILPAAIGRTIVVVVIAAIAIWLEIYFNVADQQPLFDINLTLWTIAAFFIIWILSLIHLLLLRISNAYTLRNDSLEIKTGILTSKSFAIASSGFSDLEVVRSISDRIINSGDIIIRTQSETDSDRRLRRVRDPLKVADQIREVMARPIVRIENPEPPEERK